MKILRLDLLAFGPFTEQELVFDAGDQGLHVVYGPNEAGKSSALRALRQLLFGIESRTTDNFLHAHQDLKIGAVLKAPVGTELEVIRRKGNKNTLRGPDGESLVQPIVLEKLLGSVDEDTFRQQFGIDYEQLVEGGRSIANGSDVGQILFDAARGAANLSRVQAQLSADAAAIFKPAGSAPSLNVALRAYSDARRLVKDSLLPGTAWKSHDEAFTAAKIQKQKTQEELDVRMAEQRKLMRIQEALPLIASRGRHLESIQSLGTVPDLPPSFTEERRKLANDLAVAESTERNCVEVLAGIANSMKSLEAPQELLDQEAIIKELQTGLGAFCKAAKDRPGLESEQRRCLEDIGVLVRELGKDIPLGEVERLRVPRGQKVRLQELGTKQSGLMAGVETANTAKRKLMASVKALEQELAAIKPLPNIDELKRLIARVQKQGSLEQLQSAGKADLARRIEQAELDLAKLRPWQGTLSELESLTVSSVETIERFDGELHTAAHAVRDLERDCKESAESVRRNEQEIEALRLQQDVPTEDDLEEARQRRQAAFQAIRDAWKGGGSAVGLLRDYEERVTEADDIADRLRREANQVAAKARLLVERERLSGRREEISRELADGQAALAELQRRWREAWRESQLEPSSPREMRSWLAQQSSLVTAAREIRERQPDLDERERVIVSAMSELSGCLDGLSISAPAMAASLASLLAFAEETSERIAAKIRKREELDRDLQKLRLQIPEVEQEVVTATGSLAEWRDKWSAAVLSLALDSGVSPAQVNAVVSTIDEILARQDDARKLAERIQGIDVENERFAAAVRALVAIHFLDLRETSIEQTVTTIGNRLTAAQQARAKLDELSTQRAREEQKLADTRNSLRDLQALQANLCREANCESPEDLPAVEERANRRREARRELATVEKDLLRLAAGSRMDDFIVEAAAVNADEIDSRLQELSEMVAKLETEKSVLDQTLGREENELKRMNGSAQAADANEASQALLAQIHSEAAKYVRLKLASAALAKAVERYRERHQGPVLARASELFAELTLGSFAGLKADYNDKGEAVLLGVRGGGKQEIGTSGMSDGTCDQMYLALRLASLEEFLKNNPPLPFIVDDILIKFDDDRAVAALKALARVSQQTQVIFFTHHEHLVALARENLDDDVLFVHNLAAPNAVSKIAQAV